MTIIFVYIIVIGVFMSKERWIWIDCEMTGLNPKVDRIIEIAVIVTDDNLKIIAQGPNLAIHQDDSLLAGMDSWNTKHHTQSGLVDKVRASSITEADAQEQVLEFLNEHCKKGKSPLCGNSVWQDRRFIEKYMPDLAEFFHYRHIDVSTIKLLAKSWNPKLYDSHKKKNAHEALGDIIESIEELKYYQSCFFDIKL